MSADDVQMSADNATDDVQSYIKKKYPYLHYIHCCAHLLNLLIKIATSQHAKVRMLFQ